MYPKFNKPDIKKAVQSALEMQENKDRHEEIGLAQTKLSKLQQSFERSLEMQENDFEHWLSGTRKNSSQNLAKRLNSRRNDFFEIILPEARTRVNTFLISLGIDINHTLFAGGVDERGVEFPPRKLQYLFDDTVIMLSPEKQSAINIRGNFEAQRTSLKSDYSGDTDHGIAYLKNKYGSTIEFRQKSLLNEEHLHHELYHEIFEGLRHYLRYILDASNTDSLFQLSPYDIEFIELTFQEGLTEFFKQVTLGVNNVNFFNRSYPNDVALIVHLISSIIDKYYKGVENGTVLAIKEMAEWGISGGLNSGFYSKCKGLRTASFPFGLDIYKFDEMQMSTFNNFLNSNSLKSPDLSEIVNNLGKELGIANNPAN
jgi:hypothetical protein